MEQNNLNTAQIEKNTPHVRLKSTPKSRVPPNLYFRTFCRLFYSNQESEDIFIWLRYENYTPL